MKVLLIGDTHIPEKADDFPEEFAEEAANCDLVICTGDLTEGRVLDRLFELAEVRIVCGEEDYIDLPEQDLVMVEGMKFGVIHGHQLEHIKTGNKETRAGKDEEGEIDELVEAAELVGADVLVTGHTHKPYRTEKDGVVLLNPGSATGAGSENKTCMVVEVEGTDMADCRILTSE